MATALTVTVQNTSHGETVWQATCCSRKVAIELLTTWLGDETLAKAIATGEHDGDTGDYLVLFAADKTPLRALIALVANYGIAAILESLATLASGAGMGPLAAALCKAAETADDE